MFRLTGGPGVATVGLMCNLLTSALVVSLTLVLASCGTPTRRTGAGGELGEGGCPAGEERTCDCEGGDAGVEVCLEDGSAWGECGCGAAEGEGEGPAEGEGEGEGAAEGEGEGPAEGEGEGPGEGEGEGPAEGEGEGPGEGEGEGPAEGEGEGEGEVPPGPPDPDDVDLEWGWGFVMDSMVIDAQAGFDLDGDGQRNNALSLVGLLANDQLAASLADGQLTLLFDLRAEDPVDNPEFPLHFYMGQDQDGDASDNFSGEEEFVVELTSFDGAGDSLVHFNDTVIEDRRVSAATNRFPLSLPAGDGVIEVTLYYTQLEADV